MTDNRNTILAVILSGLVLLGWQYFFNIPQMEKQRAAQLAAKARLTTKPAQDAGNTAPRRRPQRLRRRPILPRPFSPARPHRSAAKPQLPPAPRQDRNPASAGSISLKGARIDDLSLVQFRETVDPTSPPIVLYSPSGTENPITRSSAGSRQAVHRRKCPTRTRSGSRTAPAA